MNVDSSNINNNDGEDDTIAEQAITTTQTNNNTNNNDDDNTESRSQISQSQSQSDTNINQNSNTITKTHAIQEDNSNNNNNNNNGNDINNSLSKCMTCKMEVFPIFPNTTEKIQEIINSNSVNNTNIIFARQCMYRHCPTRSNNSNCIECEGCSHLSRCRGCNMLLCNKCRKTLTVLECDYNRETNDNNDNTNNTNDESDDRCNTFICSQLCYKKIIHKYTILLKFNGFDPKQHHSITNFKKLFMKPYLTGLYDSLMVPNKETFIQFIERMISQNNKNNNTDNNNNNNSDNNNNNSNNIVNEYNSIRNGWHPSKTEWFPFHECQGCKKHNCGCTEWVCCIDCRKYYCEQCEEKLLHRCKLDECENHTCCRWQAWTKSCFYCNDLGKCQLLFCTNGHCDRHFIS